MVAPPDARHDAGTPAPGSDFYYAILYLDAATRQRVACIEACRREIARIPLTCSDRGVALVKLAWWQEDLQRLPDGSPRHEITQALAPIAAADDRIQPLLCDLVGRIGAALADTRFATRSEVFDAFRTTHAGVLRCFIRDPAAVDEDHAQALIGLGCWIELGYELLDIRRVRQLCRLPIAGDVLERHGRARDDVRHARTSSALEPLLTAELTAVASGLGSAYAALPRRLRKQQPMLCTLAHIVKRRLRLALADGCQLLEHRIEPTPLTKLWLAWRTATFG